ncbi:glutathione S-transferase family protein [Sphingomonas sp. MMS24-J13]|uniref:glutathione S-transferase family protein n=1 Tax=Sphingomonas sp. MMS24-J13 TaxID=3238686 RepID=UPI00384BDF26
MLTFYFAPRSSSMAAHIALHETGAPFEPRPLSLLRDDNHQAAYLDVNPEGKVPALLIDGRLLTEVAGILFYLARRFPEAHLIPEDPEGAAQVVSWMSFLASSAHPAWRTAGEDARAVYTLAEARIGADGWAVGHRLSIADIHLFRLFWRFHAAVELQRSEFPKLFAHHDRMLARPAVQRVIAIEAALA